MILVDEFLLDLRKKWLFEVFSKTLKLCVILFLLRNFREIAKSFYSFHEISFRRLELYFLASAV